MAEQLVPGEALALARALHAEAQAVAVFIDEKVRVQVDSRVAGVPGGIVFQGQLLRVIAWLRTITRLDQPADFQAVTTAARALFEGAVDVTLMHFDPTNNGPEKLDAWEESAKLKHAQTAADYLAAAGRQPSGTEQFMVAFIGREGSRIEKLRRQFWPSEGGGRHPQNRWTGRNLARDAQEADKLLAEGFEEFYRLRYPRLCWLVHGSGTLGLADMSFESIAYTAGEAASEAARFARVVAQVVATHIGCLDEEGFRRLPEQVKEARVMVYAAAPGIRP